jgi:hypothetical protein
MYGSERIYLGIWKPWMVEEAGLVWGSEENPRGRKQGCNKSGGR